MIAACTALFLPEPERSRGSIERATLVGSFRAALQDAALRPLVIAFFVVQIGISVAVGFIWLYWEVLPAFND